MKVYTTDPLRGYATEMALRQALGDRLGAVSRRAGLCTFGATVIYSKEASLEPWVAQYRVNAFGRMENGPRHVDVQYRVALCYSFVLVLKQRNTLLTLYDNADDSVGTNFHLKAGDLIVFDARREHQVQVVANRQSGDDDRLITTGTFVLK